MTQPHSAARKLRRRLAQLVETKFLLDRRVIYLLRGFASHLPVTLACSALSYIAFSTFRTSPTRNYGVSQDKRVG